MWGFVEELIVAEVLGVKQSSPGGVVGAEDVHHAAVASAAVTAFGVEAEADVDAVYLARLRTRSRRQAFSSSHCQGWPASMKKDSFMKTRAQLRHSRPCGRTSAGRPDPRGGWGRRRWRREWIW